MFHSETSCLKLNFIHMSTTAPIVEWLEGHTGKQEVAGSIADGGIHYNFEFFPYIPFDNSSAKTIKMKSSMTFIKSNWWTAILLKLKQIHLWRRFI